MSTIAAISTPLGAGGIGILRVSGRDALKIADTLFIISARGGERGFVPFTMHFGVFDAGDFKDKGYAVYFPEGRSFTGEDTVEFYLHGGARIMTGALEAALRCGAVMADKGEFTKRAYLNGRMTLADAEGVIDMINAESAAGVRAAYAMMDGAVSRRIDGILTKTETFIATLEAALDYPDEMEDEVMPSVPDKLKELADDIDGLITLAASGRMAKHGITCVLAGSTNAGKSSLMNALLKEERAIVTPIAGTTRDTVTESFEYEGLRINLVDTAGIRESGDAAESAGIERARREFRRADVILHVIDTEAQEDDGIDFEDKLVFTVRNKCDLTSFMCPRTAYTFAVSAKTGEGVEDIKRALYDLYRSGTVEGGELITSERHISALYRAKNAIQSAVCANTATVDLVLVDLREAYDALGEITGKTATEDIVDRIFEKFCVGK